MEVSQRSGKYTSGIYPYGYITGTDSNRSAIIDEPAAEIVRRIFDMRIQGYSSYRIARALSDEGVTNPTNYRTKKDGSKIDREVPNWWSHKTITLLEDALDKIPQLIGHGKEKYEILNPTMPSENFADKWNEKKSKAIAFFNWLKQLNKDIA